MDPGDIVQTNSSPVGGPGSQDTWDTARPLIRASVSLWSQQSFSNKAQTTEKAPMLGSLSFEETAVLSSFQHIKDLFLFRCMFWSQAVRLNSRGGPGVALVFLSTSSGWPVCCVVRTFIFWSSALWPLFKTTAVELYSRVVEIKNNVCLSLCFDRYWYIQFSLLKHRLFVLLCHVYL